MCILSFHALSSAERGEKSGSDKNCERYNERESEHSDRGPRFCRAHAHVQPVHYAADTRVVNFLRRDTLHRLIIARIAGDPASKRARLSA